METIIKIHPSELNNNLLNKIRDFIGNKENVDVTISLKEYDPTYVDDLNRSIDQAESGNVISFTMEEFAAYTPKPKQ
jgi:phage-related protein